MNKMVDITRCMKDAKDFCRKAEDKINEAKTFVKDYQTKHGDLPEYMKDFEVYCGSSEKGLKEAKTYISAYLAKHKKNG